MNGLENALGEIFLLSAVLVILVVDLFLQRDSRLLTYLFSQLALIATAVMVLNSSSGNRSRIIFLDDLYIVDPLAALLKVALLLFAVMSFVYARKYLTDHDDWRGEYFVLTLFSILGAMVVISAASLVTLYLGLELMALPLYALLAMRRTDRRSAESAMKYFILGAISSGLLLYGMSLLYGVSGGLKLEAIQVAIDKDNIATIFALVFIVSGIAFKLAVVPFHMWVPDVYQGAPTSLTISLAIIPKVAGLALILRLLSETLADAHIAWSQLLIMLGVLSLVVGNVFALVQSNLKRMFAYSTIAHMGFVVLGIATHSLQGDSAAIFYMLMYVLTSAGGFAMLILLGNDDGLDVENIQDLKGLNQRSPWFAAMMLLLLFSMIGIPPLVGFYAKLTIISALLANNLIWVAIIAVLMSVVGAFYYLRVIKVMYFDEPTHTLPICSALDFKVMISLNALLVLLLGLFPDYLMQLCIEALDMTRY